jgi:chromosome segregation ATPase
MKAYTVDLKSELDEVLADDDDDLAESFFLIPTSSEGKKTAPNPLQKENDALKAEVETLRKRVADQEKALRARIDQDRELRDSIVVAKREAQRVIASSTVLPPRPNTMPDIAGLNINLPNIPPVVPTLSPPAGRESREREAQLMRQVRELEEEARALRSENEKQKAMIAKFREKWEKLKENSKKKKSARAAAEADARTGGVRERIEEEPEEEERAIRAEQQQPAVVESLF